MIPLSILLGALVAFGLWEYLSHVANQRAVPIRIHVNGTRGKSSVTRLIAAGLRAGGISTCAKTTGSRPRMILEDGSEYTIQRQGRANIIEQVRAVAVTARRGARALVAECMALNPGYQNLCEDVMLRSTVGVITNIRADHLDVMGPTVMDAALAMGGTAPRRGLLVTAETNPDLLAVLARVCQRRGTELLPVSAESEQVTEDMMRGFGYIEHPENVALALRVCRFVGVEPDVAIRGMYVAEPDIGALRYYRLAFFAKKIGFVNAFAANDPFSTLAIWSRILRLFPDHPRRIVILNCRADRPHRSMQLGEILPDLEALDHALLTGSGTRLAYQAALKKGMHPEHMTVMEEAMPGAIFERSISLLGKSGTVFGMGNIGGGGTTIVEYFQNRAFMPGEEGEEV
ncbi:MAG: poly-gamma-glutamate synthase PgsB [Deltaproteobacteria bacterium]|nr:poly-gamma-glutamate synthase PgsB [Deltaproteobacteria bacterium]